MYLDKRKYTSLISFFIILSSLSSCKKYDYDNYSKRWYCEELDFEFYNIVEENDKVEINEDLLYVNGKDYLVNLSLFLPKKQFRFFIYSEFGKVIQDYKMIGSYYIDKNYSNMVFTTKIDTLFRKYKGHQFVFTSSDIDPSQTFDPAICSSANWCTEDKRISVGTDYTRNMFGIRYNKQEVCPLKISNNSITVYDKPDGEIILTGTYSGDHRNWSIDIESKKGIFSSYESDTIDLINKNTIETGIYVPIFEFTDDNYQEIIDEFESMYN